MFSRGRRKKKDGNRDPADEIAAAEKRAASKENVRVRHRGADDTEATSGVVEEGDGDMSNNIVMDRKSMKAAAAAAAVGDDSLGELQRKTSEKRNADDGSDDEDVRLRQGRSYGDAKETAGGFYLVEIKVENWAFNRDDIIVPAGTVLRFHVDEREKAMVEVSILIKDAAENLITQSPALSAGHIWECLMMDVGSFTFEDLDDRDLCGDIEVVVGDQQTKFGMHVAKKREKDNLAEADAARRKLQQDENERFEADFLEHEAKRHAADSDYAKVAAALENENVSTFKYDQKALQDSSSAALDENRQQAIEDSLRLYQETVAQRRKNM